jgi:hypothetical protein
VELLCALVTVVTVVTVVGHGLWMLFAAVGRSLSEPDSPTLPLNLHGEPKLCPNCGDALVPLRPDCPGCGLTRAAASEARDLAVTFRTLNNFRNRATLAEAPYHHICDLIEARQRELHALVPTVLPVVEPVQPLPKLVPPPPVPPSPPVIPQPVPPAPPPPEIVPTPPTIRQRRSLAEWLAAFMEDRNIFWGELVGGLLVVGCSVALVLSLWQTLEQIPLFPFLVFVGVTAGLFEIGQYTLRQWRLTSTSRGLLVIATLLVPLNFLVLAGLSPRSTTPWEFGVKLGAIPLFGWLLYRAATVLFPSSPGERRVDAGLLTMAVLGAAVAPLAVPRLLDPAESAPAMLVFVLATWPVAFHVIGVGLAAARRSGLSNVSTAWRLLALSGLAVFPLTLALGFLVYWIGSHDGSAAATLQVMSALIAAAGVPTLVAGLLAQRRLADTPTDHAGLLAATATGVALIGTATMLAGLPCAWPEPALLIAVGLFNFVVLTVVAFRFGLPIVHGTALCSLTVAFAVGTHVLLNSPANVESERAAWLVKGLVSANNGTALVGLATFLAVAADRLRRADGAWYAAVAGCVTMCGLVLVAVPSIVEPSRAAVVGSWAGAACVVFGFRWRLAALQQTGSIILFAATTAALHWLYPMEYGLWGTVFALEALVGCMLTGPWRATAALASTLAVAGSLAASNSGWPTVTAGLLATTALCQAARSQRAQWSWVASGMVLVSATHFVLVQLEPAPSLPVVVLLTHATVAILAALAIGRWRDWQRPVLVEPLLRSGLGTTLLAVPCGLLFARCEELWTLASHSGWLGLLWLTVAIAKKRQEWFTAFQAAVSASVLFVVAAWLDGSDNGLADLTTPASLRRFALGLAALAVAWMILRLLAGRHWLINPSWPALDRLTLGALVIFNLGLAIVGVTPGVLHELGPAVGGFGEGVSQSWQQATDPVAWGTLGLLAAALIGSLWEPDTQMVRAAKLLGLLAIGVTTPVLAAGWFAPELATASALRWGLAISFLGTSVAFWVRTTVARAATRVRLPSGIEDRDTQVLRVVLLCATAVPAVLVTVLTVRVIFLGYALTGPAPGSLFNALGPLGSHAIPLVLVMVGLVGHALRERSPADAFGGGLVANLIVTGGYALGIATSGGAFDDAIGVRLWQRFAMTAGVWAIGWLALSHWRRGRLSRWWEVQRGLAIAGNFALLGVAADMLAVPLAPMPTDWTRTAAENLGWLTLAVAMLATALPAAVNRQPLPSGLFGGGGLGLVVLSACTLADVGPLWGLRTLLIGGAGCTLLLAIPAVGRRPDFARWLGVTAALTSALALKAAIVHGDRPLAAIVFAAVAAAVGGLGLRHRRDGWVLASVGGFHVAASLVVWHRFFAHSLESWLVPLVQTNGLVAASLSLVWHRFRSPSRLADVPLAVAAGAQLVLLLLTLPPLLTQPSGPHPTWVFQYGQAFGGVVLVTTVLAWLVAADRRGAAWTSAVCGTGGLFASVWLASHLARWDDGNWLAYHALQTAWLAAGATALVAGRASRVLWVLLFTGLATALALRAGWGDPLRPYAPAMFALAASGLVGGLAAVERRIAFVVAAAFLLDLGCVLTWLEWGPATVSGFVSANVFGFAAAASAWSFADRHLSARFRHTAAVTCVGLVSILAVAAVAWPAGTVIGPLTWAAWGMTLLAVAQAARDPDAEFVPQALYVAGLAGVVIGLKDTGLTGEPALRVATVAVASYVLLAQVFSGRMQNLFIRLGYLPADDSNSAPTDQPIWFVAAQITIASVAVGLSAGVALAWGNPAQRLLGPLAAGLTCAAGVLLVNRSAGRGSGLAYATFAVGALTVAEIGWALVNLHGPAVMLNRTAAVVAGLAFATIGCSFAIVRVTSTHWANAARRTGPVFGLLGAFSLIALVAQEGFLFDPVTKQTPLTAAPIALVAMSLAALIVAAILFAVRPQIDPFRLNNRRRPLYVYAAEALLVLLFLHLRFNVPGLFPAIRGQYWAFVVMAIAFVGVGLAELLRRKDLDVVAGPLQRTGVFMPLLPLLAFWLHPPEAVRAAVVGHFPGAAPLLKYLDQIPQTFDSYALLWLLFGLLYTVLAVSRRSYWYSLAAALAANVGLWALWHHGDVAFLAHPQLWLIPLALIVLASELHHRDRLAPEAAAGLRYLGLGTLYLSSTADLFLAGLGNSALLPVVLAVLSVAGVLAGILFRVRSYLYLGAGFLTLVVGCMIWHAAVGRGQSWVWWASGVVLGAAILALFAVFENRRPKLLAAIEEFRAWQ